MRHVIAFIYSCPSPPLTPPATTTETPTPTPPPTLTHPSAPTSQPGPLSPPTPRPPLRPFHMVIQSPELHPVIPAVITVGVMALQCAVVLYLLYFVLRAMTQALWEAVAPPDGTINPNPDVYLTEPREFAPTLCVGVLAQPPRKDLTPRGPTLKEPAAQP